MSRCDSCPHHSFGAFVFTQRDADLVALACRSAESDGKKDDVRLISVPQSIYGGAPDSWRMSNVCFNQTPVELLLLIRLFGLPSNYCMQETHGSTIRPRHSPPHKKPKVDRKIGCLTQVTTLTASLRS